MTYGGSIGHVTDDVTRPREVTVVTIDPDIKNAHYLENVWR